MNQYDEYAQMMNGAQSNGISQSNGIIPVQPIVQPANITNEAVVIDSVDIRYFNKLSHEIDEHATGLISDYNLND